MSEDWRVHLVVGAEHASAVARRLEAGEVEHELRARLAERIAVSHDGSDLFLYASSEDDARIAAHVSSAIAREHGSPAAAELSRWHDDAEDWESPDRPLPQTDEEHAAERARLMGREDLEAATRGYPDWEVRVELPTRRAARELAERLEHESIPSARRWRYLFVGALDEDSAHALAERIRAEGPAETRATVEGTLASVQRSNPFAVFGLM